MTRGLLLLAFRAVSAEKLRSLLSVLGIAIGIAAVILLTSIGEGTRRYLLAEFSQFGTNLIAINPGKTETTGIPGAMGGTTHRLTIDDAESLKRVPGIEAVMPVAFGTARVEAEGRGRSVYVYGVTPDAPKIWRWGVRVGNFWETGDPRRGAAQAVLGPKLRHELFGSRPSLGEFVHIGGRRFRVVGLMEPKGQFLGFDLDDSAYIPVASALQLFNMEEVGEIDVVFNSTLSADSIADGIRRTLMERHNNREDFTITTQAQMLKVFGNVMNIITVAVGAIGGISLVVGAIGILTMMWIAVGERTEEIGLVRALGGTRKQIQVVFLTEAAALATSGGVLGVVAGLGVCALLRVGFSGLPVHTPMLFLVLALLVSAATGFAAGVLPARHAAQLDPIEALRAE